MMKITGQHPAEDLLLSASMPQSTDLRQIGLVDDIVEKPEDGGPRGRWAESGEIIEAVEFCGHVSLPQR
jgi:enoyl-CoA hydratase/carnithine racemase